MRCQRIWRSELGVGSFIALDVGAQRMNAVGKEQGHAQVLEAQSAGDVIGHGSPTSLPGMSAAELAAKSATSSGGHNVRLLSCQTGCPTGTFAQDLANRLGVRVMGPTTDIGASGTGKTLTIFDEGAWRWFNPN